MPRTWPGWMPPALLAGSVAVTGFGAMAALWSTATPPAGLPGWTDYTAATFGDGLFLPLLAASLCALLRGLPPAARERQAAALAGGAGLAGGALLQLSWLADAGPELNWSLPEPHVFSVSGWYHAVFLCCASSLFAALASLTAVRARALRGEDPLAVQRAAAADPGWLYAALTSLWAFCGLVMADGGQGWSAASTLGSVSGVGVASAALLVWALGRQVRVAASAAVLAGVSSGAIVALVHAWPPNGLAGLAFVMSAAFGCIFALRDLQWPSRVAEGATTALITAVLMVIPLARPERVFANVALAVLAVAAAAVVASTGRDHGPSPTRVPASHAAVCALLLATLPVAAWFSSQGQPGGVYGAPLLAVATGVFASWMLPVFQREFAVLQAAERRSGSGPDPQLSRLALRVSLRAGAYALLALTGLIALGVVGAMALGFEHGSGAPDVPLAVLLGGCLAVAAGGASLAIRTRSVVAARALVLGALLSVSATLAWHVVVGAAPAGWPWLAALAAVVAMWHFESVVYNAGMRPDWAADRRWALLVAPVWAITAALLVGWRSWSGLYTADGGLARWEAAFAPLALTVLLVLWLALVVGASFAEPPVSETDRAPRRFARYRLSSALMQDAGLMAALSVVAVWLPLLVHAHVPGGGGEQWAAVLGTASAPVMFLAPAFFWCLRNNVDHVGEQAAAVGMPHLTAAGGHLPQAAPGEEAAAMRRCLPSSQGPHSGIEWVGDLRVHVRHQNVLATVLAGLSIAGVVGLLNERVHLGRHPLDG